MPDTHRQDDDWCVCEHRGTDHAVDRTAIDEDGHSKPYLAECNLCDCWRFEEAQ